MLNQKASDIEQYKALLGFDGFLDKIIKPVKQQKGEEVLYYETITDYAQFIANAAGRSCGIELSVQNRKIGGNAPIMANALAQFGITSTCIGAMGYPKTDILFESLPLNCRLISIANPGQTDAYEFDDGKLICSDLSSFKMLTWEHLKAVVGKEQLGRMIADSSLVAFVDWNNLFHGTTIWAGIAEEILPELQLSGQHFFFDIADPSKRSIGEIQEIMAIIGRYSLFGDVTLGLNANEAAKVYLSLKGIPFSGVDFHQFHQDNALEDVGLYIFEHTRLTNLLIHPTDCAILFNKSGAERMGGRVVKYPKISTGAGDNLNAGFALGCLLQFALQDAMILGMAASGAYVQNGHSANLPELIAYLQQWDSEL